MVKLYALVQLGAGGLAGGFAAAATNPLDVVKTRLQLEGVGSSTRYGTMAVVRCTQVLSAMWYCLTAGRN